MLLAWKFGRASDGGFSREGVVGAVALLEDGPDTAKSGVSLVASASKYGFSPGWAIAETGISQQISQEETAETVC